MNDEITNAPTTTTATDDPRPFELPADLSAQQARERIDELTRDPAFRDRILNGGKNTRESKMLAALQHRGLSLEPDKPSLTDEEQIQAEQLPPATPEGYGRLDFGMDVPAEGASQLRTWMHDAGVSKSGAVRVAGLGSRDVAAWQTMSDQQRQAHEGDTIARFNRSHGADAPTLLAGARRLVAEVDRKHGGKLSAFLEDSGAGASLAVIEALADAARRRYSGR